jgi:ADP-heptose:LPS heptosyltransferase
LGDVVLSTGVVERLGAYGEQVAVATNERFVPIFEGLPVSRIWTPKSIGESRRYDRVIDLQANATSRRLLRGLGPVRRNRSRSLARRLLVFWGRRGRVGKIPHAVLRYAEAAGLSATGAEELRPRLVVEARDLEEAAGLRQAWAGTEDRCVALAEGGSRRMKRWPGKDFDLLEDGLARNGYRSLRFVEPTEGPKDGDRFVRAELRGLKGLLSRCAALITNDSGVMHMAVGLGVPVVAIFGSTVTDFGFAPLGERDRVIERDLPCRPCAVHGARFCWQGHGRCLGEIESEAVLQEVCDLLGREGRGDGLD